MKKFETGAVRDTGGKGRMDLVPWCAVMRISRHMENANARYPERNWEKGLPMHSMLDSAMRHLAKYMDGWIDEDHLAAAATNLLMALWTEEKRPKMQDIPSRSGMTAYPATDSDATYEQCSSYDEASKRCMGTAEVDPCKCGGDPSKCDFYPEKRNR